MDSSRVMKKINKLTQYLEYALNKLWMQLMVVVKDEDRIGGSGLIVLGFRCISGQAQYT